LLANLPAKPIFSKNELNSRGKIEDRQKFLTKKMSEISFSKNIVSEKYIFYALFFNTWRMPSRTVSITGFIMT